MSSMLPLPRSRYQGLIDMLKFLDELQIERRPVLPMTCEHCQVYLTDETLSLHNVGTFDTHRLEGKIWFTSWKFIEKTQYLQSFNLQDYSKMRPYLAIFVAAAFLSVDAAVIRYAKGLTSLCMAVAAFYILNRARFSPATDTKYN